MRIVYEILTLTSGFNPIFRKILQCPISPHARISPAISFCPRSPACTTVKSIMHLPSARELRGHDVNDLWHAMEGREVYAVFLASWERPKENASNVSLYAACTHVCIVQSFTKGFSSCFASRHFLLFIFLSLTCVSDVCGTALNSRFTFKRLLSFTRTIMVHIGHNSRSDKSSVLPVPAVKLALSR